ncbi:MAG: hypothetical protein AVDCRST_MAG93-7360 [uncultured Chloroflexia bacterium]|uniref:Uncharacterized protein n=1 Tax=uncultured Chloroflexia bacterium TaxID=1672391 RepID=A0A6J4MER9_9CHLR|nr:MAG: hypothetical protein AVDCRST_MAG93-7360 [uncultured Chloroflexia bacterium]
MLGCMPWSHLHALAPDQLTYTRLRGAISARQYGKRER